MSTRTERVGHRKSDRPDQDIEEDLFPRECPATARAQNQQADEALLRVVYDTYGATLFEFVLRRTSGDRQWAEEVVQETMLRVWRHVDHIDFAGRELRPLLCTIARRIVIDGRRMRRARPYEVPPARLEELPAADELDRSLVALTVKQALRSLSPAHRRVIVELYVRGRTIDDVAAGIGVPSGTVRSRAYYGLRALRGALERLGVHGIH